MFAKLILALKHHPWISKLNERTKTMNCFIASPLKMSSLTWAFLAAKTTLQERSQTHTIKIHHRNQEIGRRISKVFPI